jgi:hypothetical protein
MLEGDVQCGVLLLMVRSDGSGDGAWVAAEREGRGFGARATAVIE